jgi:hypothetical protein
MSLVLSAQNGPKGGPGGGTVKGNCHKCGTLRHSSKECPDGNSSNGHKTHRHNPSQCKESNGQQSHNICQQEQLQQQSWISTPPATHWCTFDKKGEGKGFQLVRKMSQVDDNSHNQHWQEEQHQYK